MTGLVISTCHRAPASSTTYTVGDRTWKSWTCDACLQPCKTTAEPAWGPINVSEEIRSKL